MATSDEFPRGWTANVIQNGSAVQPQVLIPASAGIVHVLDSLFIKWTNYIAGAPLTSPIWTAGSAAESVEGVLLVPAGLGSDSVTLEGLQIKTVAGGLLAVQLNLAPAAGQFAEITIQGYDL